MPIIVTTSDFDNGFYGIALNNETTALLQSYIDRYEATYIRKLFGVTMGNDFIADKSNPTQDPIYVVLEDAFQEEYYGCNYESLGMADLLTALIFYHYVSDNQSTITQSGVARKLVETANVTSPQDAYRYAEKKWNEAISTWDAIQLFINENESDYPDFNGEKINPKFSPLI
jgi:hypothetical protein